MPALPASESGFERCECVMRRWGQEGGDIWSQNKARVWFFFCQVYTNRRMVFLPPLEGRGRKGGKESKREKKGTFRLFEPSIFLSCKDHVCGFARRRVLSGANVQRARDYEWARAPSCRRQVKIVGQPSQNKPYLLRFARFTPGSANQSTGNRKDGGRLPHLSKL